MPQLFDPLTIRSITFRNRIWVSAMCQYSISAKNGVVGDWHLVHLGGMARGGAGLVMAEATGVSPEARISDEDTGIWNAEQASAWARVVSFIHSQGAAAGIQLAHAGRKASIYSEWSTPLTGTLPLAEGGWQTVSASDLPFADLDSPLALDAEGLDKVVADFEAAGRRALDAGFDVLEVHAAHGYLVHQFLSPLSNKRDDEYGGSLENRARLLLRIVAALRALSAEAPLFIRFSATDYAEGGWDQEQTATVAGWAHEAGADFFDISSGGNITGVTIPSGPGYQVHLATFVHDNADVPVSAVGRITEAQQASDIVTSGRADAVMLGREMLRDPHFALRAAHELGVELEYWPKQYLRARWS